MCLSRKPQRNEFTLWSEFPAGPVGMLPAEAACAGCSLLAGSASGQSWANPDTGKGVPITSLSKGLGLSVLASVTACLPSI